MGENALSGFQNLRDVRFKDETFRQLGCNALNTSRLLEDYGSRSETANPYLSLF